MIPISQKLYFCFLYFSKLSYNEYNIHIYTLYIFVSKLIFNYLFIVISVMYLVIKWKEVQIFPKSLFNFCNYSIYSLYKRSIS